MRLSSTLAINMLPVLVSSNRMNCSLRLISIRERLRQFQEFKLLAREFLPLTRIVNYPTDPSLFDIEMLAGGLDAVVAVHQHMVEPGHRTDPRIIAQNALPHFRARL